MDLGFRKLRWAWVSVDLKSMEMGLASVTAVGFRMLEICVGTKKDFGI